MKKFFNEYIDIIGIAAIIYILWISLEISMYGEIKPNDADTIIYFILIGSLHSNLVNWNKKDKY